MSNAELENILIVKTSKGDFSIKLRPDLAPNHVQRVKELANKGEYDGVVFHRVIADFMAQTGDVQYGRKDTPDYNPGRAGMGGSSLPDLAQEFNHTPHVRGTVSMARSQNRDSANSQFFICFTDAPWLNKQYTVFGEVPSEDMSVIDKIKKGEPVTDPDHIISIRSADVLAANQSA